MSSLLELAGQQAESAELFQYEGQALPVKFKAGSLTSVTSSSNLGRALRVIKDGKIGFSTTTDPRSNDSLVERAIESAQFGDTAAFSFSSPQYKKPVPTRDESVEDLDVEDLVSYGQKVLRKIEEHDSNLEIDINLLRGSASVRICNTAGLDFEERRTKISLGVDVKRVGEEDIFSVSQSMSARFLDDFNPDQVAEKILQKLEWAEQSDRAKTGKQTVVFTPRGVLVLLLPLIAGLNGKNVYLNSSPLGDQLGEQVFDARFGLRDSGRLPGSPSAQNFDDEGIPTREKELIRDGVVNQFIYDLKTAAMASTEPTGNGFKGGMLDRGDFRSTPSTAPSGLVVSSGEYELKEFIENVEEGLLVDQVLGLGQGNVISGQFSNNVAVGYRIQDGNITGRVKNTMIAGNVYDLLSSSLLGLGAHREWIGGIVKTPPIAVNEVNVVREG